MQENYICNNANRFFSEYPPRHAGLFELVHHRIAAEARCHDALICRAV